jgi:hypothetical protein
MSPRPGSSAWNTNTSRRTERAAAPNTLVGCHLAFAVSSLLLYYRAQRTQFRCRTSIGTGFGHLQKLKRMLLEKHHQRAHAVLLDPRHCRAWPNVLHCRLRLGRMRKPEHSNFPAGATPFEPTGANATEWEPKIFRKCGQAMHGIARIPSMRKPPGVWEFYMCPDCDHVNTSYYTHTTVMRRSHRLQP